MASLPQNLKDYISCACYKQSNTFELAKKKEHYGQIHPREVELHYISQTPSFFRLVESKVKPAVLACGLNDNLYPGAAQRPILFREKLIDT